MGLGMIALAIQHGVQADQDRAESDARQKQKDQWDQEAHDRAVADFQDQQHQRALELALQNGQLADAGIMPQGQAPTMRTPVADDTPGAVPGVQMAGTATGGAPGITLPWSPGTSVGGTPPKVTAPLATPSTIDTGVVDPSKYRSLGGGYAQDVSRTGPAIAAALLRKQQADVDAKNSRIKFALKRLPQLGNATDDQLQGLIDSGVADDYLKNGSTPVKATEGEAILNPTTGKWEIPSVKPEPYHPIDPSSTAGIAAAGVKARAAAAARAANSPSTIPETPVAKALRKQKTINAQIATLTKPHQEVGADANGQPIFTGRMIPGMSTDQAATIANANWAASEGQPPAPPPSAFPPPAPFSFPPSVTPKPPVVVPESSLSAADLWEKKVAEGMSNADATAYVKRIKGGP